MNDKQKLVLFRAALAEMGLKMQFEGSVIPVKEGSLNKFSVFKIKGSWSPDLKYCMIYEDNGKKTCRMYGVPETNKKIIDLIKDILEVKIDEIEFYSDEPLKDYGTFI
jgi:hypothetical protein